jgi:hypothetical protein
MLIDTGQGEREARDYLSEVMKAERLGFSQRVLRRLPEANYYHGIRETKTNGDTLLSQRKVKAILEEEASR